MVSAKYPGILYVTALVLMLSCRNDPPTGPDSGNSLLGTWYYVQEKNTYYSDEEGTSQTTTEDVTDTGEIYQFTESELVVYYNDYECYGTTNAPYTVSENRILGDRFNGSQTYEDGEVTTWNVTFDRSGNQLHFIVTFTYSDGWHEQRFVMEPYSGPIPPPEWPSTVCPPLEKRLFSQVSRWK
jgi:hypothetical protein